LKILIVDDTPINQKLLRAQIEGAGHSVFDASNGIEALKLLETTPVDVVITDILMPHMDGYTLCYEIRNHDKLCNLPIIFYTATYTSEEDEKASYGIGADLYLRKPASADQLEDGIREVISKAANQRNPSIKSLDQLQALKGYNGALVKKLEDKFFQLDTAHDHLLVSELRYRNISETAQEGIWTVDKDGLTTYVNPKLCLMLGYSAEEMLQQPMSTYMDVESGRVLESAYKLIRDGGKQNLDFEFQQKDGISLWAIVSASPIFDSNNVYSGALAMVTDITDRKNHERIIREALGKLSQSEKHNRALYEAADRRLGKTLALRNIDNSINSSFDLKETLGIVLEQAKLELQIDAGYISLYDSKENLLQHYVSTGLRAGENGHGSLHIPTGFASQAILGGRRVDVSDLREEEDIPAYAALMDEGLVDYHVVPLIAKGKTLGILGVFKRSLFDAGPEWLEFLETLAGQAAIAIDNITLFDGMRKANTQLVEGYDATIEGWSRALDLRDKETQGHTQRVAAATVVLAKEMGVNNEDLVHVRRGALLHDIGKMGIPDMVLLKPGPLTEQEWATMRQHPQLAHDMLSPIKYLEPALDIPFCHHEKWDGSGYPRKLKGDEIPFFARIFSVVDVYDALTSDRPYRQSWPKAKVLDYIQENSGTYFDPAIVSVFLQQGVH
jgi:PAS domain S-box-containing protein/putative nucleotidyltransferase with HDIG domain